jgi:transposase InsO family protein
LKPEQVSTNERYQEEHQCAAGQPQPGVRASRLFVGVPDAVDLNGAGEPFPWAGSCPPPLLMYFMFLSSSCGPDWAYTTTYQSSGHRRGALPHWLNYYNHQRPHGSLGHKPPMQALTP